MWLRSDMKGRIRKTGKIWGKTLKNGSFGKLEYADNPEKTAKCYGNIIQVLFISYRIKKISMKIEHSLKNEKPEKTGKPGENTGKIGKRSSMYILCD